MGVNATMNPYNDRYDRIMVHMAWVLEWKRMGLNIGEMRMSAYLLYSSQIGDTGLCVCDVDEDEIHYDINITHEREIIDSLERKGAVKRIGGKIVLMPGVPWPNVLDVG